MSNFLSWPYSNTVNVQQEMPPPFSLTVAGYLQDPGSLHLLKNVMGLYNAKIFPPNCRDLIVIADHKALLYIFNNRDLSTKLNPRILKLKEKTLRFNFTV